MKTTVLLRFNSKMARSGASEMVQLILLRFTFKFAIFVVEAFAYRLSSQVNHRAGQGRGCHNKTLASQRK